jgi:hypothetical protein
MFTRSHQRARLAEEATNNDLSRDEMGRSSQGSSAMGADQNLRTHFDKRGDIMFVDVCDALPGDQIDVIDVGEESGFPGQIQVRVNREKHIFYGITIQNFSTFKRRLFWEYRMASVHYAILWLITSMQAGFSARPCY